ncbi:MAG: hypothetical protein ACD_79C00328G0002 [uncultured bacterium]|nr:MAG: hypothetical protein ACD_79C00328G0002 [uncultured bacterium]
MEAKRLSLCFLIFILFTLKIFSEYDIDFKGMMGIYAVPFATDRIDYIPFDIFDTDKLTYLNSEIERV